MLFVPYFHEMYRMVCMSVPTHSSVLMFHLQSYSMHLVLAGRTLNYFGIFDFGLCWSIITSTYAKLKIKQMYAFFYLNSQNIFSFVSCPAVPV
jgi:hypothetical protein